MCAFNKQPKSLIFITALLQYMLGVCSEIGSLTMHTIFAGLQKPFNFTSVGMGAVDKAGATSRLHIHQVDRTPVQIM